MIAPTLGRGVYCDGTAFHSNGWTPFTLKASPSFRLSAAGRRPHQKFTRPRHAFTAFSQTGARHRTSALWGVPLFSHPLGRVRCLLGASHFSLGREAACLRAERWTLTARTERPSFTLGRSSGLVALGRVIPPTSTAV